MDRALELSWGISDVEEWGWGGKGYLGCLKSTIINGKVRNYHYALAIVWTSHSKIAFVYWLSWQGVGRERNRAVPVLCWMQEVNGIDAASFPAAQGGDHSKQKMRRNFMWFSCGALPEFLVAFLRLAQMKNHTLIIPSLGPRSLQEQG